VERPDATLVDDPSYPLFAVAFAQDKLVAAGGGAEGGFVGIPVHFYALEDDDNKKTQKVVVAASE
jgi:hypothetical protein